MLTIKKTEAEGHYKIWSFIKYPIPDIILADNEKPL